MDIFLFIAIYSSLLISADFNIDDLFLNDNYNFVLDNAQNDNNNQSSLPLNFSKKKDMPYKISLTPPPIEPYITILKINHDPTDTDHNITSLKRKRDEKEFYKIATSKSPVFDALIILAHYENSGISFMGPEENGYLLIDDEHKLFINTNKITPKKSPTNNIISRRKTYAQKFTIYYDENKTPSRLMIKNNHNDWYQRRLNLLTKKYFL